MSLLVAWALSYAGFTAVCLAADRHHHDRWGHAPERSAAIALRALGFALLAGALAACAVTFAPSNGVIAWFGILTAAALPLALGLPFAPRVVIGGAVVAPLLAIALALTSD